MDWDVKKSDSDTYVMHWCGNPRHCWWAVIFVNSQHGCLSIQSDFGDYSYRWSSPGSSLKEFLSKIGDDYLIDKLSYGNKDNFYESESMKALRTFCDELKKDHPRRADDIDYAFDEVESSNPRSADAMWHLVAETAIGDLMEDYESYGRFIKTGPSHQLLAFVKEIWPGFKEVLKKEIEDAKTDR